MMARVEQVCGAAADVEREMSVSREAVLACLKEIKAPSGVDLVEAGLVRALNVEDGAVRFVMEVDQPDPFLPVKAEAEEKLAALGATSVSIVMTALELNQVKDEETLQAIKQKIEEIGTGARILGFNYDTGERYLSTPLFEGIEVDMTDDEKALSASTPSAQFE